MNPLITDTDRLIFLAQNSFRAPGPTKFHPVYVIVDSSVWAPRPLVPNEKLNALREAIDASMPPAAIDAARNQQEGRG